MRLPESFQAELVTALLAMADDADAGPALRTLGVERLAPTSAEVYEGRSWLSLPPTPC